MDVKEFINEKRAIRVCEGLKKRNMNGIFVKNREEACNLIIDMIPKGAVVGLGGSITIIESGLLDRLREEEFNLLDRYKEGITPEEINNLRIRSMTSDVFISSTNAITLDGTIISADGYGNRVSSIIFGPKKVIIISGINKIVDSIEDGIKRIREIAAPMNSKRLNVDTPCMNTGFCDDENCFIPNRLCNTFVIIEGQAKKERINVIIVGEELGY
jgi:hypothetical protein